MDLSLHNDLSLLNIHSHFIHTYPTNTQHTLGGKKAMLVNVSMFYVLIFREEYKEHL